MFREKDGKKIIKILKGRHVRRMVEESTVRFVTKNSSFRWAATLSTEERDFFYLTNRPDVDIVIDLYLYFK